MNPVIHRVLLADLNSLAEIWEVSSDSLGVDINPEGELVPKIIDESDDLLNLTHIQGVAERAHPDKSALDLVVSIQDTIAGVKMRVSTMNYVCSPQGRITPWRWYSYTDTYREQMH